jgi:deazaflavin-dependent oxidoreductase (nitroreductase family)
MDPLVKRPKPSGLLRVLLRAPVYLYRAGLGWLFGSRFLMLTHRGRRSGLPRQTVVEVVDHDEATGTYFIVSGWGEKSDWLLNVQQTPVVEVQVGRRRFAARAERLDSDAAWQPLCVYGKRHPRAFRALARIISGHKDDSLENRSRALARAVPVIALRAAEDD